jgi:hypothetical protein
MNDLDIEGYATEIHQGVWRRVESFGAPRVWAGVWLVACAFAVLRLLFTGHTYLMFLPVALWPVGHGILVLLMLWDRSWDDILLVSGRYKDYYEQG